jgi:hypothetical protein
VVYFLLNDEIPILALLLYGKNEQANPTPDQKKAMRSLVDTLKAVARQQKY